MPLTYRYELSDNGDSPLILQDAKDYLKIEGSNDNKVLQDLIGTVTQWGERYTGRDFRAKTWKLVLDEFCDRILLRKSLVATVTSAKYMVDSSLVTIDSSVNYLKIGSQFSEILLAADQAWPTDMDEIEAGIEIIFVTGIPRYIEEYRAGMLNHLAYLYQNRGDCDADDAAEKSGATKKYDQGRIARI